MVDVTNYSLDRNGEYLITFIYEDKKYNQIVEANLTLTERMFDK